MAYTIIQDKCEACGKCKEACPVDSIVENGGVYTVVADDCVDCGTCEGVCPTSAAVAL